MVRNGARWLSRVCRHNGLAWHYVLNLSPTFAYWVHHQRPITDEAARVLATLNREGVAVTSATRLLEGESCYAELCDAVGGLEQTMASYLAAARAAAADRDTIGQKTFIVSLLGECPVLDPASVYARFALQNPILTIANAYFGMYTRLRYYNVWRTFCTDAEPRESQLWHRDREDHYVLKVFAYLADVDEGAGPFTYAPGTHPKGRLRGDPVYFIEGGVKRVYDGEMARLVPPERWLAGVGPKGTIIFADTRGYHKGGLARERDRLMYTCMFTSRASQSREFFERPAGMFRGIDGEIAFALG